MNIRHLLTETLAYLPPAQILSDIDEKLAAAKPAATLHSIGEIVAHMDFWQSWFLHRVEGRAIPMAASAKPGWPDFEPEAWNGLRAGFLERLEQLAVLSDDPVLLARPVTPAIEFPPMALYTVAEALIHAATHNAHHFGQVITWRQIQGSWPPPSGSFTW